MGQRRLEKVQEIREDAEEGEVAEEEEENSGGIAARLNNLNIETEVT